LFNPKVVWQPLMMFNQSRSTAAKRSQLLSHLEKFLRIKGRGMKIDPDWHVGMGIWLCLISQTVEYSSIQLLVVCLRGMPRNSKAVAKCA
jgi:hypothetical protein